MYSWYGDTKSSNSGENQLFPVISMLSAEHTITHIPGRRTILTLMITLDENSLIGCGTLRACYLHPRDNELIVKVGLPGRQGGDDANHKEFMSYEKIRQSHEELHHISHCHGFEETDRGEGLICDCIRDFNGDIAKTIWDIVVHQETCDIDEIQEAALTLCKYLIANDLFLFDINLKNIVLRRMQDGSCRAYAVDLKGPYDNKEFLQLSSRIKFLGRKKLKRRSQQLLERIVQFREQRELLKKSGI